MGKAIYRRTSSALSKNDCKGGIGQSGMMKFYKIYVLGYNIISIHLCFRSNNTTRGSSQSLELQLNSHVVVERRDPEQ